MAVDDVHRMIAAEIFAEPDRVEPLIRRGTTIGSRVPPELRLVVDEMPGPGLREHRSPATPPPRP